MAAAETPAAYFGESEGDELEYGEEEGEDSFVSDEAAEEGEEEMDSEEVPETIPIAEPGINNETRDRAEDSVSDIDVSASSSSALQPAGGTEAEALRTHRPRLCGSFSVVASCA